jgi:hypothetical protein
MREWTMADALGERHREHGSRAKPPAAEMGKSPEGFYCRRCSGVVYESSERTSVSSTGCRVDVWDRFVRRISAGVLRGSEVRVKQEEAAGGG